MIDRANPEQGVSIYPPNIPGPFFQRTGEERKYRDLIAGRFALNQVVRIERTDDPHTISNKWFDFSYSTIYQLIQQGINDALKTLVDNLEKSKDSNDALDDFINVVNREEKNRALPANQATQLKDSAKALKASQIMLRIQQYQIFIIIDYLKFNTTSKLTVRYSAEIY